MTTGDNVTTKTPKPLTADEVRAAINELPARREDLREGLRGMLGDVERSIPILTNAPRWVEAQNVIFISKLGVDDDEEAEPVEDMKRLERLPGEWWS